MLAIGRPIVTASAGSVISASVDQTVVSVGPYTLTSRPTRGRSSRASGSGSASPPATATTPGPVEAGVEQHPPARGRGLDVGDPLGRGSASASAAPSARLSRRRRSPPGRR